MVYNGSFRIGLPARRSLSAGPRMTMATVTDAVFAANRWFSSAAGPRDAAAAVRATTVRNFASVSTGEVEKFDAASDTWWDPSKNAPLIGMNAIRVRYIRDRVADARMPWAQGIGKGKARSSSDASRGMRPLPLEGLKALDIGCGGGLLSESLCTLGSTVTGIDPSERIVHVAEKHAKISGRTRDGIRYLGGTTAERLLEGSPSLEGSFDIVCLLEVLEHATDAGGLLRAASSLLKPGTGRLFLSTMDRTLKSYLLTILGAEYIMGYVPVGTHDWNKYRSPEEVRHLADAAGLRQLDVRGLVLATTVVSPLCGDWTFRLDPDDTDVNWIGTYRRLEAHEDR